jgi:hypothetical protein
MYRMLIAGATLGVFMSSSSAQAEDALPYCQNYAHAAIEQSRAARQFRRCMYFVQENPGRWTLNYADHFNWCMSVFGSGQNRSERAAREDALNQCTRGS